MKTKDVGMLIFYSVIIVYSIMIFVYAGLRYDWIMHPFVPMGSALGISVSIFAIYSIIKYRNI